MEIQKESGFFSVPEEEGKIELYKNVLKKVNGYTHILNAVAIVVMVIGCWRLVFSSDMNFGMFFLSLLIFSIALYCAVLGTLYILNTQFKVAEMAIMEIYKGEFGKAPVRAFKSVVVPCALLGLSDCKVINPKGIHNQDVYRLIASIYGDSLRIVRYPKRRLEALLDIDEKTSGFHFGKELYIIDRRINDEEMCSLEVYKGCNIPRWLKCELDDEEVIYVCLVPLQD